MTYPCPTGCGAGPFTTQNGAVMHAINKTDEDHDSISDKASAYAALEGVDNQEAADESEGTPEDDLEDKADDEPEVVSREVDGPEFPTAPDGPADEPVVVDSSPSEDTLEDTPEDDLDDDQADQADDSGVGATEGLTALGGAALLVGAFLLARSRRGSHTTDDGPGFEVV